MYGCKYCGKPLENSIEGELVCKACWIEQQMTDEEKEQDRLIREAMEDEFANAWED